jgi:hypothetical protein
MIPQTMNARRNRARARENAEKAAQSTYTKQKAKGKQVWLSYEAVQVLALAKKPGERSLMDVADRLLLPIMKDQVRNRPYDQRVRRFKTRTGDSLPKPRM